MPGPRLLRTPSRVALEVGRLAVDVAAQAGPAAAERGRPGPAHAEPRPGSRRRARQRARRDERHDRPEPARRRGPRPAGLGVREDGGDRRRHPALRRAGPARCRGDRLLPRPAAGTGDRGATGPGHLLRPCDRSIRDRPRGPDRARCRLRRHDDPAHSRPVGGGLEHARRLHGSTAGVPRKPSWLGTNSGDALLPW